MHPIEKVLRLAILVALLGVTLGLVITGLGIPDPLHALRELV